MPMSIESLWTKKSSPGLTQRGCLNIFLCKRTDLTARMGPNLSRYSIKSASRPGMNLILHEFSFSAFGIPKRQATGRTTCGTLTAKSVRDRETIAHRLGADPESWNRIKYREEDLIGAFCQGSNARLSEYGTRANES